MMDPEDEHLTNFKAALAAADEAAARRAAAT